MKTHFLIPANLNLPLLLEEHGFQALMKAMLLDKLHYLLDLLMWREGLAHEPGEFIPLKAEYLRAVIGQRYADTVKNALLQLGVIETNGSYRVKVHSIGYRMAKQFRSAGVRRVPIADAKLAARIVRQSKRRFAEAVKGKNNLKAIARGLSMVTVNFELADQYMRETSFTKLRAKKTRLDQLQAFLERDFYLTVDRQGRVHHNYVALSNDLKKFTTMKGEPFFAVDVGNMQPALLTLFYKTECEERARYIELVSGNDFYNFFNQRMKNPVDLTNATEKKHFKQLLFKRYLFCRDVIKHEIRDIFEREFPILAIEVQTIKAGCHQRLARRLQEIEASIVIGEVIKELAETYPKMPLLSAHDCIVTTNPFVQIAERMMKQKFEALLGFEVPVSSKQITSNRLIEEGHAKNRFGSSISNKNG